jgi:hypothetical protein
MNFGKYVIIEPVTHQFEKEPNWFWKIKPPTSGDEYEINKFLVQNRVQVGPDNVTREFPPTHTEIAYREIALLFGGTNIPEDERPVEDGGTPVIKDGASLGQIEAVLKKMPHAMVMEIWGAIADAVPGWGPHRPKASTPPTQESTEETK